MRISPSFIVALALLSGCGRTAFSYGELGFAESGSETTSATDEGSNSADDTSDVPPQDDGSHGLTWVVHNSDPERSVVLIGTDAQSNAYNGDTPCTTALPIACLEPLGLPNPGIATDFYNGWTGGALALTAPVVGTDLTSIAVADALCAEQLGQGFRMGEHHDGMGGWNWWAYGDTNLLTPESGRFWVHIYDQPGNCWNSTGP